MKNVQVFVEVRDMRAGKVIMQDLLNGARISELLKPKKVQSMQIGTISVKTLEREIHNLQEKIARFQRYLKEPETLLGLYPENERLRIDVKRREITIKELKKAVQAMQKVRDNCKSEDEVLPVWNTNTSDTVLSLSIPFMYKGMTPLDGIKRAHTASVSYSYENNIMNSPFLALVSEIGGFNKYLYHTYYGYNRTDINGRSNFDYYNFIGNYVSGYKDVLNFEDGVPKEKLDEIISLLLPILPDFFIKEILTNMTTHNPVYNHDKYYKLASLLSIERFFFSELASAFLDDAGKFNFVDKHRTFASTDKLESISVTMSLYDQEKNDFLSFGNEKAKVTYEIETRERRRVAK